MDSVRGPGPTAVPFVSQSPLLCGGAAAAMVERFWGRTGVRASAYRDLVLPEEGGIRTGDLVRRLGERGFRVRTFRGTGRLDLLADSVPLLVLLGDDDGPRHYVVVTAAGPTTIWLHDPNRGPGRRLERRTFLARWKAADFWTLVARPVSPAQPAVDPASRTESRDPSPALAPGDRARVDRAIAALRDGAYARARTLAAALPEGGRAGALGWQIRATAHFREGDRASALSAWNRIGEPVLDHVEYRGFQRTRHRRVELHAGLEPGRLLRPSALRAAERRVGALPEVRRVRLDLTLLPEGDAQLQGYVSTRPVRPGVLRGVAGGLGAWAQEQVEVPFGPLTSLGERWRVEAQWAEARRRLGGSLALPAPVAPGVATLSLVREEERYRGVSGAVSPGTSPVGSASRVRGALQFRRWVTGTVRLGAGLGLERRGGGDRFSSLTVEAGLVAEAPEDRVRPWAVRVRVTGWTGEGLPSTRVSLRGSGGLSLGSGLALILQGGVALASRHASRLDWPGAGTGRARPALLRGRSLISEGTVGGPTFGRQLAHLTVSQEWSRGLGPLRIGMAGFVDAAWVRARPGWPHAEGFVAPGTGAFVDLRGRRIQGNVAWGGRGPVWSVTVHPGDLLPGR